MYSPIGPEIVDLAREIATEAHEGQPWDDDTPYIFHPTEVALLAEVLGYPREVIAACFLHDTDEDTDIKIDELRRRGIPEPVLLGVEGMTWRGDPADTRGKIEKARSNPISHVGKFCDSSVNESHTIWTALNKSEEIRRDHVLKYPRYLGELVAGLPTPERVEDYLLKNF